MSHRGKADDTDFGADRDLYSGLIRLHILHHAVAEPIFGLGMIEELARHGYRISPGSLYPLLHGLETKGYVCSTEERDGKSLRKVYRATSLGRRALAAAKSKSASRHVRCHAIPRGGVGSTGGWANEIVRGPKRKGPP
jgi:DNA-binding PadR family transcriptional regulator